jgi:hypothetical protein
LAIRRTRQTRAQGFGHKGLLGTPAGIPPRKAQQRDPKEGDKVRNTALVGIVKEADPETRMLMVKVEGERELIPVSMGAVDVL